jgi:hypothetical protein
VKTSKIISVLVIVLQVGGFVLFAACGQTIFSILTTSFQQGGQVPFSLDPKTNIATLMFTLEPQNCGYLESKVTLGVRVTSDTMTLTEGNSTTITLPPGASKKTTLVLKIPYERLQLYSEGRGSLELTANVQTLYGLASMDYRMQIKGGGGP